MDTNSLKCIKYRLFVPGGNVTALVDGLEKDIHRRREIQDIIMERHVDVEQVGFFGIGADGPELIMTGGEFCGNAARSAAWQYLGGNPGETAIRVSGASRPVRAGVKAAPFDLVAWAEMPLGGYEAKRVDVGMTWIVMEGISHLVLTPEASSGYIAGLNGAKDAYEFLRRAQDVMQTCAIRVNGAYGVIFTEILDSGMKIHPCVFVQAVGSAFYETACGSGSAAVAIALGKDRNQGLTVSLLQPSGMHIEASVRIDGGRAVSAIISGAIGELPVTKCRTQNM